MTIVFDFIIILQHGLIVVNDCKTTNSTKFRIKLSCPHYDFDT